MWANPKVNLTPTGKGAKMGRSFPGGSPLNPMFFRILKNLRTLSFSAIIVVSLAQLAKASCGVASFYGPGLYGSRTANGETLRPGTMTAAHPYLPMGTRVRVTNQRNGRSVIIRVNDRGPYTGGRIIDLNKAAAGRLGMISSGVADVCISRI